MRRFSAVPIAAICAIAFADVSTATDLPAKAPRPAVTPFPLYNWTGFYIGGNLGGDWSTTDWTFFNGATFEPTSQNAASWVAGAQLGYLYQFTPNWAAGLELSWSGTNLKATSVSDADFARINIADRNQSVNPGFVTPQTVTTAHADIQTVWTRVTFWPAPLIRSY